MEAKIAEIAQKAEEIRTKQMKLVKLQSDKNELLQVWGSGKFKKKPFGMTL